MHEKSAHETNRNEVKQRAAVYIVHKVCTHVRAHMHTLYILCIYYILCRRRDDDNNDNNEW